ncbi:hypothetical protein [Ralstonia pickettii]|uniref:Transmembrane protein n=1 Tax=Ralstonia pickettii TaxID=329 RepID=A0AAW4Q9R8_RALPI|nr:hypothetical protein [Ralstonia pickettii]MBA9846828.1 hypothetical protein [Ralstonia pickettii]MBA9852020.1 hypothetical protein [Ralstonia pickettii]MBA9919965.1 hypothetical protein [Ralstonia pickettii]MBA9959067.1 hypothetical protein [Ralstonia pickettii]MBA9964555.1 hypothetical protein [Ralstonia pickettii]
MTSALLPLLIFWILFGIAQALSLPSQCGGPSDWTGFGTESFLFACEHKFAFAGVLAVALLFLIVKLRRA